MTKKLEATEESVSAAAGGELRFLRWKLAMGDEGKLTFVVPSNFRVEVAHEPPEENDDGSVL